MSMASFTRIPLAGGGQETLLSEVGSQYLLPLFSTREACALRLVCREFLAAVSEQVWEDRETMIKGRIASWRACFPRAHCANVTRKYAMGPPFAPVQEVRRGTVVDADFVHFEGLRELRMAGCTSVTDAAFVHLRGINALDMSYCGQAGITDAAFAHLRGIHTLDVSGMRQMGITDVAISHLRGIHTLRMRSNGLAGITDAAFVHLRGIHTLNMANSRRVDLTALAFVQLVGIKSLLMIFCNPALIAIARAQGLYLGVP